MITVNNWQNRNTTVQATEALNTAAADILLHLDKLSIRGLVLFGGIYNDVHGCLSRDGRTEANGQQFDELGHHLRIHVQHLHVASTETAPEWTQKQIVRGYF